MLILLKVLVPLMFLGVLIALLETSRHAIRYSCTRAEADLSLHRQWANRSFWLSLLAVLLTELTVRLQGGVKNSDFLPIHLAFAVPFLVLLIMLRFWLTGVRSSMVHRWLAYACLAAYLGTFFTGFYLLQGL